MSGIMDLLMSQLGQGGTSQISRQIGADPQQTESAITAAMPALLGAMQRNSAKPGGAEALLGALRTKHDGSILERKTFDQADEQDGDGILKHLLGGRRENVESNLSRASGLDQKATQKLMSMLAPTVMGAVGRQQRERGLDATQLSELLTQERQQIESKAPKQGIIDKLLDADGDGDTDVMDFVKHGGGLLGKFLGR